ncbi:MAG: hypothetical protein J6J42_08830 [Lachnospiraceae bacterium]|nr:hypothetical protein [Lachnospiraceae bacterium]
MKKSKKEKVKLPMSLTKKLVIGVLSIAAIALVGYLVYYFTYFVGYDRYEDFVTSYEYEAGTAYQTMNDTDVKVEGMDLVAENDYLKLYTDTTTGNVAVYDKRDGSTTYSNPLNAEEDEKANKNNKNYLKSQMMVYYYNADVKSGTYDTYTQCVEKGQLAVESIANGIRYLYTVGQVTDKDGNPGIYFEIPLEYRLDGDSLVVSIPTGSIKESKGSVYRIQLLRYMGAAHKSETGYMVVPNASGSIINFNNGKLTSAAYSQYIYDIDPMAATYTTTENLDAARLPIYGICREDRSLLVEVEDGAATAVLNAEISGKYNDYNYAYPIFVLRNVDNLRNFGESSQDVFVLEEDIYDINATVRYTFLNEDYSGYAGLANYYREKLIAKGVLTPQKDGGDLPFYYDIIGGVKETAHFLGIQRLDTFAMTTYADAEKMAKELADRGITNQVMNLQGWFNEGYYHDAPHDIRLVKDVGSKAELEDLNDLLTNLGGTMYADVEFQRVTYADTGFNWGAEGSRYYGAGYVAGFGLINPTTLRNTSGLGYAEPQYDLLSPKFLPRYVEKFAKKIDKYDISGLTLRDLASYLTSDKKRTNVITREEALDVVLAQLDLMKSTGKKLMTNSANAYGFAYSSDIINVPMGDNAFAIVDKNIPLYQMIIHGCISYSTDLLNYDDSEDMTLTVLRMIETGTAPHYVFTEEASSRMKNTGMNQFYATTYEVWKDEAVEVYNRVNAALKYVTGAEIIDHEISGDVRKVTYSNGVTIYINYSDDTETMDGKTIPAMSYEMEGI